MLRMKTASSTMMTIIIIDHVVLSTPGEFGAFAWPRYFLIRNRGIQRASGTSYPAPQSHPRAPRAAPTAISGTGPTRHPTIAPTVARASTPGHEPRDRSRQHLQQGDSNHADENGADGRGEPGHAFEVLQHVGAAGAGQHIDQRHPFDKAGLREPAACLLLLRLQNAREAGPTRAEGSQGQKDSDNLPPR